MYTNCSRELSPWAAPNAVTDNIYTTCASCRDFLFQNSCAQCKWFLKVWIFTTVVTEPEVTQLTNAQSQTERLETGSWEKTCLKSTLHLVSVFFLQNLQLQYCFVVGAKTNEFTFILCFSFHVLLVTEKPELPESRETEVVYKRPS